jgi:signal transduction histidine kinase
VVRRLTVYYGVALVLIAGIVVSYARIRTTAFEPGLTTDFRAVDLVAQQEEASQRLARDALAALTLSVVWDNAARVQFVDDIATSLAEFQANQSTLRGTTGQPGLRGQYTEDLDGRYAASDSSYQAIVAAAKDYLATFYSSDGGASSEASKEDLATHANLLVTEGQVFEAQMKEIGNRYAADGANIQQQEAVLDKLLVGLTMVALLLVGLLVFLPATRRVGQSIDELAQAQEQQRELAALKDQFIIYANHELRTPVMALYSSVELLNMLNQRPDDPLRRTQVLQRAMTSGDALIRLLQSVLDTSTVEARSPRLEPTTLALAPLIRKVLETFDPREIGEPGLAVDAYQARSVTMDIPADLQVFADEGRVHQVLVNLLSNALKYSAAGSPIVVTATRAPRPLRASPTGWLRWIQPRTNAPALDGEASMARVAVRDQGLGVPRRDAGKLFNRFVRLERDIAGTVRGTGLGLYLCRTLVEAMEGQIWVESSGIPGEGSTFVFTLPLVTPAQRASRTTNPPKVVAAAVALEHE